MTIVMEMCQMTLPSRTIIMLVSSLNESSQDIVLLVHSRRHKIERHEQSIEKAMDISRCGTSQIVIPVEWTTTTIMSIKTTTQQPIRTKGSINPPTCNEGIVGWECGLACVCHVSAGVHEPA